jgi:cytochrome c
MKLPAAFLNLLAFVCFGSFAALADCPTPPGLAICEGCHWLEPGRPSRAVGPNLVGVAGQPAMHAADFEYYSLSMKAAQAKGLTWTDENLMAYLLDPKTFLSDFNGQTLRNSMSFHIEDETKRKAAVEGLKIISACQ